MFVSVLSLFKIGIGPSSSHTMGPMLAANQFMTLIADFLATHPPTSQLKLQCTLKGSLSFTGKGHATDKAVVLGLHGYTPLELAEQEVTTLIDSLWQSTHLPLNNIQFNPKNDIIFDQGPPLAEHPNGMILTLTHGEDACLSETYFSIGGGFITTLQEMQNPNVITARSGACTSCIYPLTSAKEMLKMAKSSGLSLAQMKQTNELQYLTAAELNAGLDRIWQAMQTCVQSGLKTEGILPGGLKVKRRAKALFDAIQNPVGVSLNDWLCAYAMAVNEENAAGSMVVTAPTNGAAGVIPAVLYYFVHHENGTPEQVREFLLTASAIGAIIKYRSSISGAELGCQAEVGSASAMAAAGLCAVRGGTAEQIENAAEIALEHHLGMTCDPVKGLVQVPCIERNGFGAIKAYTATSLALRGNGEHFMPLDGCIDAMKQTGLEMSHKFKETSLGGLAVSVIEC
ncbi:L-serine ammonia-lyase [Thiosulfativibrio zosterae]|uniref:L-serine dehydratase n=1 Tax=Thiosulfativibrio zosterae TaxID=2675053 RepID=A0A6F8PKX3_9GAMM|nr:L-serine ammonia-lyase [Thiosulfativibrio zosterae]BBP42752.1 L-serine dehydratase [Thiosulfativibrio zosterae]